MSAVLEAEGLLKLYPADDAPLRAVDGVDLRLEVGEMVSVMGPSGCGKSTLLHLLGGLDRADAGQLVIDGRPVPTFRSPHGRGCVAARLASCSSRFTSLTS